MVGALRITTNIRLASAVTATADGSGMSVCAATVGDRVRSRTILHYTRASDLTGGFVPILFCRRPYARHLSGDLKANDFQVVSATLITLIGLNRKTATLFSKKVIFSKVFLKPSLKDAAAHLVCAAVHPVSGGFVPILQQTNARYRAAASMFTRGPIDNDINGIIRTSPKSRILFCRRPYSILKEIYGLIYNNNNQTDYVSGCRIISAASVFWKTIIQPYTQNQYLSTEQDFGSVRTTAVHSPCTAAMSELSALRFCFSDFSNLKPLNYEIKPRTANHQHSRQCCNNSTTQ